MNRLAVFLVVALILALTVPGAIGAPVAQAPANNGPAAGPSAPPAGWQIIKFEDFEGPFPSTGWSVSDWSSDGFQRYWGKDDYKPHAGAFSVWPASGGAQAVDPAVPPNHYPDTMNTRMIYGPFDLSNALDAQIEFWLWLETEVGFEEDYLFFGTSPDGSTYNQGGWWEGTLDWTPITVALTDYIGDSSVWVRWDFNSDFSVGLGGAFVDDITISKQPLDPPAVLVSRSGNNVVLSWEPVTGALTYEVWRGTNAPYFTPGSNCAAPPTGMICTSVTTSHTDDGALGNTADNYSYVVLSVKGDVRSRPSNRVGEFDFGLTKGN